MRLATLVLLLCAAPAFAQTPGSCITGTAEADLNLDDVRARLFNTGNLFFGNTTVAGDGYIAPKGSGTSPIFAAGIWFGGAHRRRPPRGAADATTTSSSGPARSTKTARLPDPDDCSPFDRIFVVDAFDVERYDATGVASDDLAAGPSISVRP